MNEEERTRLEEFRQFKKVCLNSIDTQFPFFVYLFRAKASCCQFNLLIYYEGNPNQ